MVHYHEPTDAVVAELDSDIQLGLSAHQAEQRLILSLPMQDLFAASALKARNLL